MAHEKKCPVCDKTFWGNINKVFCTDSCRKYNKRNPHLSSLPNTNSPILNSSTPLKGGQGRTKAGGIGEYIIKKGVDALAHRLKYGSNSGDNKAISDSDNASPLVMQSLTTSKLISDFRINQNLINLPEEWYNILGELTTPFKMLIWGEPGQGKSTYSLKLASEIARIIKVVFISGEENMNGKTFNEKVRRCVNDERLSSIQVLNRLPNIDEWNNLIFPNGIPDQKYDCVFYDSISVLKITPMYPALVEKKSKLKIFNSSMSHIFISHAQKDGKSYKGESGWGHEVDIIIQIKNGVAIIEKNRFATDIVGQIGATYKIF